MTTSTSPVATPPVQSPAPAWSAGRVVSLVSGAIAGFVGIALLLAGLALVLTHAFARDADGYYTSDTARLSTGAYALTLRDLDFGTEAADAVPKAVLGRVRIGVESPDGGPVFVGIARERHVDAYLRGVAHAQVDDLGPARYLSRQGGPPARRPGAERIWVASAEGTGRRELSWEVDGGRWAVVAMNADGARRVTVDADVAGKPGWLLAVGIGLTAGGMLLLAAGVTAIALAARRPKRIGGST